MRIDAWLADATRRIVSDNAQLDAELLLAWRLGKNRTFVVAFPEFELSVALCSQLAEDIERLAEGCPLAYVTGTKAFWDMELEVSPATLIPRPDTETLIEVATAILPPSTNVRMIDLGTGSGAIAIALSRVFPQADITATDMSSQALAIAQRNALQWQRAQVRFLQNSWLDDVAPQSFDMIISNPPYIVEGDEHLAKLRFEPITALTAPENGLADIVQIIQQSQSVLTVGGWLLLEHGYDQGAAVRSLFDSALWAGVETRQDMGGRDRVTMAQRVA